MGAALPPPLLTAEECMALASAIEKTLVALGANRPFVLAVTDDGTRFSYVSNARDGRQLLADAARPGGRDLPPLTGIIRQ